jgi:hypothetical protein
MNDADDDTPLTPTQRAAWKMVAVVGVVALILIVLHIL